MKRADQILKFKVLLPHVNVNTVQGMLMLQGFISGVQAGEERFYDERASFKREVKNLKNQVKNLEAHIANFNQYLKVQEVWQKTGDEL
jgi:hypothetical protein